MAIAVLAAGGGPAAAAPRRVVSLHLCTDQLLLGLADRGQIASLSHFAGDPVRSPMAAAAKGLRRNYGTAEEAIDQRADLVLSVAPAARATVQTLRRLGYRVIDLKLAKDFAAIRQHIRTIAAALGHPDRGVALIAAMDRRLAAARADAHGPRPVAVIWQPGGFTDGPGSLEDAVLRAAGFDNLAARLGLGALGHLPLERLVLARPELVVNWMGDETAPSLAREALHHPALRRAAHGTPVVTVPPALWTCGTWFTVDAVELLAAARRRLVRTRQAARGGYPPPRPSPARPVLSDAAGGVEGGEGEFWNELDLPPPPRRGRDGEGVGPQSAAAHAGTQ